MSDRVKGFTVILDKDYKDEDAQTIANALGMVKGVMAVKPSITDTEDRMNRSRMRIELQRSINEVFKNFDYEQ